MSKKQGYMWYPKDWKADMSVFPLSLQEKGFYRELIDLCFLELNADIVLEPRISCRIFGINVRTLRKLIRKLHESSLIVCENFEETSIHIPSVVDRITFIKNSKKGGESSNPIPVIPIEEASTKEKEKEKEKENVSKDTMAKPFSFLKSLVNLGIKKELVKDFLKNRKLKRLANTETAFKTLVKEFEKNGEPINELFEKIVANGWGSFKNNWSMYDKSENSIVLQSKEVMKKIKKYD